MKNISKIFIIIALVISFLGCSHDSEYYGTVYNNQLFDKINRWGELTVVSKDNYGRELFNYKFKQSQTSNFYVYMICRADNESNEVAVYDMDCYIMSFEELELNGDILEDFKSLNDWNKEINTAKETKYIIDSDSVYVLSEKRKAIVWNTIGYEYDDFSYESIVTPSGKIIYSIYPVTQVGEFPEEVVQAPTIMIAFDEEDKIINMMELEGEYIDWKEQIREFKKIIDGETGDGSVSPK